MVRASRCCTLALLVLSVLSSACQRSKHEKETRYEAAPATMPAPPTVTAAEPDASQHLDTAHENFAAKNLDQAAEDIRSAADRLRQDARHAPGEARNEMRDAAKDLDRAAGDVRSGALNSAEKLDREMASASASLARFHALKATDAWVASKSRTAGNEILSAVAELETASRRFGHDLSNQEESFSSHARTVGQKLAEGVRVADKDVGVILRGLDREIDELFRELSRS